MERRKFLRSFGLLGLASFFAPKILAENKPDEGLSLDVNDKECFWDYKSQAYFNHVSITGKRVDTVPDLKPVKYSQRPLYSELYYQMTSIDSEGIFTCKMKDDNLKRGHVVKIFGHFCYVHRVEDGNIVTFQSVDKKEFYLMSRVKKFWIQYSSIPIRAGIPDSNGNFQATYKDYEDYWRKHSKRGVG